MEQLSAEEEWVGPEPLLECRSSHKTSHLRGPPYRNLRRTMQSPEYALILRVDAEASQLNSKSRWLRLCFFQGLRYLLPLRHQRDQLPASFFQELALPLRLLDADKVG
jgi:hypothetical protein